MTRGKKIFLAILLFGTLIGLGDTAYLATLTLKTQNYWRCDFAGFNCNRVLQSRYSTFGGIPLSFWGLSYFLILFFGLVSYLSWSQERIFNFLEFWLGLGTIVSLGLLYLQGIVLKAFCFYCLIVEGVILIMFVSWLIMKLSSQRKT